MNQPDFVIVDVETTGLFPAHNDRIVEIALIRLSPDGKQLGTYETLVNPERDVGPTYIHGITAREVSRAPRFSEVATDVMWFLRDAVVVGHNVSFDARFLLTELTRARFPIPGLPTLCTMQLTRDADPVTYSRKLEVVCQRFGIPLSQHHAAMADATATACLFEKCVSLLGGWEKPDLLVSLVNNPEHLQLQWPPIALSGLHIARQQVAAALQAEHSFLAELVSRLPVDGPAEPKTEEYLVLLDRVLEDRRVTQDEADALLDLANQLGFGRQNLVSIHRQYLADLVCVAWRDGVVTESERRDLSDVARLLDISEEELDRMVNAGYQAPAAVHPKPSCLPHDLLGKTICFTGEMNCFVRGQRATRDFASSIAEERGMIVKAHVSKKLNFLVAADADSQSSKAKKARECGTRILAEPVFWRLVGIDPDS